LRAISVVFVFSRASVLSIRTSSFVHGGFLYFMERNAAHVTDFFNLPSDQVVEIGRQISI
jgi:K+ transporter